VIVGNDRPTERMDADMVLCSEGNQENLLFRLCHTFKIIGSKRKTEEKTKMLVNFKFPL
jgi:hypothetical protein